MRIDEVLDTFLGGRVPKTKCPKNLYIQDGVLYNYGTPIAKYFKYGLIILNNKKYSRTTSRHQNYIRARADVLNVDEDTMKLIIRCSDEEIATRLNIDL